MKGLRPTRAVVDLDALARNFHTLSRGVAPGCAVMPVVKADGYGHGAAAVARRLQREGATSFAVAVVEEAAELRRDGVEGEILVMGWIGHDQLPDLIRHGLVANAHSLELLAELAAFSEARRKVLPLHLKLDTGMTRLGLLPADLPEAIAMLKRSPWLRVDGVFQNFASADDEADSQSASQIDRFAGQVRALTLGGVPVPMVHVANSAGTLAPPRWPTGLLPPARVRPGLILYTRFPGPSLLPIEDVMTLKSVVDQVKEIPAGTRVGYGGTFVAPCRTMIAIVPGGYADGIPRSLSGVGSVLVRGTRCPIAGRISMDLTAVDVTGLSPAVRRGEEAVFFGSQGGTRLGVEELAAAAGTVGWEVLCGVGPRVPRMIVEGGSPSRINSRFFRSPETCADDETP